HLLETATPSIYARILPFVRVVWDLGTAHWLLQAVHYTMTPDNRPLIGQLLIEGLWVNTGYSGHGIMLGPAGGRLLVDLLTGKADENPFAPGRAFERRRPPPL